MAVPRSELNDRVVNLREALRAHKLSAALITTEQNVHYLSGFPGQDSALLLTLHQKFLLTDFRYLEAARASAPGFTVVIRPAGLMEKVGHVAKRLRLRKLAVEPANLRLVDVRALRHAARRVRLRPVEGLVGLLRLRKSPWEIRQIEHALRIQETAFTELCRHLRMGSSEREAAAWLRFLMVKGGAEDQGFETMFLTGAHASRPHGHPDQKALKAPSLMLIDWGARHEGYHSDLTRTFFLGTIPRRLRQIHQVVMRAQQEAIARVGPGVALAEVDAAARKVITQAGFGKAFGHSTGHGLGLEIHEMPTVSARAKGTLQPGMVVTVEPGIYLPGVGGVRIEDDVLVTPTGYRVLSRLPKGLRWDGGNE